MSNQYDLGIKKPVAFWNRELSISPRNFFCSLSKAILSGTVADSKGTADNFLDALKEIAPKDEPGEAAWTLIYKSLLQALTELIYDYRDFCQLDDNKQNHLDLATELENALNSIEIEFDGTFFNHPEKLPLLDEIKTPLCQWLISLGMAKSQTIAIHLRLKNRFTLKLHQEWLSDFKNYNCIEKALKSPFFQATAEQRSWLQYRTWLQEQANERMFAEAFSLKQVYVPLRAYYEVRADHSIEDSTTAEDQTLLNPSRVVVDLHTEVEEWVRNFNKEFAVRIISGGPGSGKSSFAKMFSAFVAREIEEVPVIFVPLHHFNPSDDLVSAMEQFIQEDRYLTGNPFHVSEGKTRLLIVFDGLDELSMQGKAAAETAQHFIDEVIAKIDRFNAQGCQRQVLITGRDMSVQSASIRLRAKKQILHVLPYLIPKGESNLFKENKSLLEEDQRDLWWKSYGAAKGLPYDGMPTELRIKRLTPITQEPLLNYLVALSFERNKIKFSEETTLNNIYKDLLHAVHERQWDHGCHEASKHLELFEFVRVLEEVSLAVWHGDGRTATVNQIYNRCENSRLTRYLKAFQDGAEKGVSRLLTAFYFRQSEQMQAGEKTFEFTHKSFGEYLISKRIVRSIIQIHTELTRYYDDPDTGFDEREALKRWVELCGPTTMDRYVFRFLCDEIASNDKSEEGKKKLKDWQQTFAKLFAVAMKNGMPMEQLNLSSFKKAMLFSRNAEEALMAVHYACAKHTKIVSKIIFDNKKTNFGEYIKRLQGQRHNNENKLISYCLGFLDLRYSQLSMFDFAYANLDGSNLYKVNGYCIIFLDANLIEANLSNANLINANFTTATLIRANLENAALSSADFLMAHLEEANLSNADLSKANFRKANLKNANLKEANLIGADLTGADLTGANLTGANLLGAILFEAKLIEANLEEAKLIKTNIEKTAFKGANIKGIKIEEYKLEQLETN